MGLDEHLLRLSRSGSKRTAFIAASTASAGCPRTTSCLLTASNPCSNRWRIRSRSQMTQSSYQPGRMSAASGSHVTVRRSSGVARPSTRRAAQSHRAWTSLMTCCLSLSTRLSTSSTSMPATLSRQSAERRFPPRARRLRQATACRPRRGDRHGPRARRRMRGAACCPPGCCSDDRPGARTDPRASRASRGRSRPRGGAQRRWGVRSRLDLETGKQPR